MYNDEWTMNYMERYYKNLVWHISLIFLWLEGGIMVGKDLIGKFATNKIDLWIDNIKEP